MNWINLQTENQLADIVEKSHSRDQLIYKHSTRCSLSSVVKSRLERKQGPADMDFYFLDLVAFRSLSNNVAAKFGIGHESPQVLLIRNGKCIYHESHMGIRMDEIESQSMAA